MSITWSTTLWLEDFEQEDHSVVGLTNLLSQYQGKPRIEAFLTAFLDQIDSIEDLVVEVICKRSLFTAENGQLDTIGKIIDYKRPSGLTDSPYRLLLTGKVFADGADGTREDFINLLDTVLSYTTVETTDFWPCTFRVFADSVTYHEETWFLLQRMAPAGVRIEFAFTDGDEDDVFQTADQLGPNESSETTRGTTTLGGLTGGVIAGGYTMEWGD